MSEIIGDRTVPPSPPENVPRQKTHGPPPSQTPLQTHKKNNCREKSELDN